ncbi:hypothetical protein GCM10023185_12290 [Hymenobacter saemangeumensis]|uniref:Uncharacterized protein n=1 Tax=Hymenobacter saemangeumensis TaxID=1084522 RepID=A0ABP8I751_9BACT
MKKGNRISAALPNTAVDKILEALDTIEGQLPFLLTLSPEESRGLRHLGFDGIPYAQAGLDAVRASTAFTRRSFDLAEFEKDLDLHAQLRRVRARLAPLSQKLEDTFRVVGADIMVTADDLYEDMRKDNGETEAIQAARQQMRKRYGYRKAAKAPSPAS